MLTCSGDTDSAGSGERLITIEGSNVQCHLAEYLLQCCVQAYSVQEATNKNAPPRKKLKANPPSASQIDQSSYTSNWDVTSQSAPTW